MSSGRNESHLSSPLLEALFADELSAPARAQAETHLAGCARCRDDLAALHVTQGEFIDVVLPRTMTRVRRRLLAPPSRWARYVAVATAAAAAAALIFAVGLHPRFPPDVELLTKGGPSLRLVMRRGSRVAPAPDGTHLRAGDEIRFVIPAAPQRYLLVGSIDGDGHASIYYPFDGQASAALDARDRRVELPGSIVIDEAQGPERIFALFSDAPLPSARVRDALVRVGAGGPVAIRAATRLAIDGAEQRSVLFEKDPR